MQKYKPDMGDDSPFRFDQNYQEVISVFFYLPTPIISVVLSYWTIDIVMIGMNMEVVMSTDKSNLDMNSTVQTQMQEACGPWFNTVYIYGFDLPNYVAI